MSQARHVGKIVVKAQTVAPTAIEEAGCVLITGGLGTLGSLTSAWLASSTNLAVQATGRTGRFADGANELSALVIAGKFSGLVSLTSADASSTEDARMLSGGRPVVGLMHASGVLADATLRNQTLRGVRTVYAPKISALHRLNNTAATHPGAFQVLFSSVAALLGSPGQGNYSAANSLLDGMASVAQQQGTNATSVQWGAWAGAGMAANDASTKARIERTGLELVNPLLGLAAMAGLLQGRPSVTPAVLSAVPIVWERFLKFQYKGDAPLMFGEFTATSADVDTSMPQAAMSSQGLNIPEVGKEEYLLTVINDAVRAVLGTTVEPTQPLMAAGMDSLSSVEFRNGLEARVGVELPSTVVFDYPTVEAMAAFLAKKVKSTADQVSSAANVIDSMYDGLSNSVAFHEVTERGSTASIILTGKTIHSPSGALAALHPIDASILIPLSRWDIDSHAELYGGLPVRFAPTLVGIDLFDAQAMNVPEAEAVLMDPQQRLLLQMTGELLLNSDVKRTASIGTYVGLSSTDYAKVSISD